MDRAERFLRRRHAPPERTGRCHTHFLRGGISRAGHLSAAQGGWALARGEGSYLPCTPVRGRSGLPEGLEWAISWTVDGPDSRNGDTLQRPLWDAPNLLS